MVVRLAPITERAPCLGSWSQQRVSCIRRSRQILTLGFGTNMRMMTSKDHMLSLLQVKFYNIENYSPGTSTSPAHTVVIDKCGTASLAPTASSTSS